MSNSNKDANLKEKLKQALTSTFKVISDDFEINSNSDKSKISNKLGLIETRRKDVPEGKFTLIFLAATEDESSAINTRSPEIELTHNWDYEDLDKGRNFGHLAFSVPNIYETCQKLMDKGVVINRPPRDGRMAFIKSPNNISIELLQQGEALEIKDPWKSMDNTGTW